jgi:diphosphomevalonate decarboxylase
MIQVQAPSNIAYIKYMGKIKSEGNVPTNSSLSLTLNKFITEVHLSLPNQEKDSWEPLVKDSFYPLELSEFGKSKFLNFFYNLKEVFQIKGFYSIKSANNFPSDCGIASSASSFAALTLAAYKLKQFQDSDFSLTTKELALISQKGSGSSCRSFFRGYCEWTNEGVFSLPYSVDNLSHKVLILGSEKKQVSSSQAHRQVLTSTKFVNRPERAEDRFLNLKKALHESDWSRLSQICFDEFVDMHELFETSNPPFSYRNEDCEKLLKILKENFYGKAYGPLVTMDAGPNIHLIYKNEDENLVSDFLLQYFNQGLVLSGI